METLTCGVYEARWPLLSAARHTGARVAAAQGCCCFQLLRRAARSRPGVPKSSLAQGHRAGASGAVRTLQPPTHTPERGAVGETQALVPASHPFLWGPRSRCGALLSQRPRPSALPKFKAVLDELNIRLLCKILEEVLLL